MLEMAASQRPVYYDSYDFSDHRIPPAGFLL